MKRDSVRAILCLVFLGILCGCEVTSEKIELWKGTVNGPQKLVGAVKDESLDGPLRAKAAIALVEINAWDQYREAMDGLGAKQAAIVASFVAPLLADKMKATVVEGLDKGRVDAKDGLFILLDYADGDTKAQIEDRLSEWCAFDFNHRALAGNYHIASIAQKVGPKAGMALLSLVALDQVVLKPVAEVIKQIGDPAVILKASEKLAADLLREPAKIQETHLVTASILGMPPVGKALLSLATANALDKKLQRFALRALSKGIEDKTIVPDDSLVAGLFELAANKDVDRYQREETYYTLAQMANAEELPKFQKLMQERDFFWRAVGFRCVLRMDGSGQLKSALEAFGRATYKWKEEEVAEIIERIASFPALLPKVRELLNRDNSFVLGVVIGVLAKLGTGQDALSMDKWATDKLLLPPGFIHKTAGDAAKLAAEKIRKKG